MTTRKQTEANRRNSRKSTGPRTAKGKNKVRYNPLRHGLTAKEILIPGENSEEFDKLWQQLADKFQPNGPLEEQLVIRVQTCFWRLHRVGKIEAGILLLEKYRIEQTRALTEANRYMVDHGEMMLSRDVEDRDRYDAEKHRARIADSAQHEELPTLGLAFVNDSEKANAFSKLSRYEAGIERALYRAVHELQRLQAARTRDDVPAPLAVDVTIDTEGSDF